MAPDRSSAYGLTKPTNEQRDLIRLLRRGTLLDGKELTPPSHLPQPIREVATTMLS